jgi:hypothetical protein
MVEKEGDTGYLAHHRGFKTGAVRTKVVMKIHTNGQPKQRDSSSSDTCPLNIQRYETGEENDTTKHTHNFVRAVKPKSAAEIGIIRSSFWVIYFGYPPGAPFSGT